MTRLPNCHLIRLTFVCLVCTPISAVGQTRTVSVDLNVTATAINRFIAAQSFPSLTGAVGDCDYLISITTPIVQLSAGSASVQFTIQANTACGNYEFDVQPSITIPNLSVTASQVIAVLQGFADLINSRQDIPAWLKPVIIDGYNSLNLVMYPSKMIDYANSAVPDFVNIQVTDIGLSFSVVPGALTFTISAFVLGTPPVFTAQWMKRGVGQLSIRFGGSVATTVKQVRVYNNVPQEIYRNESLSLSITKGGNSSQIDINGVSVTTYYITVVFHSLYGQYARKYVFTFDTANYNTWFVTQLFQSIN